MARRRNRRDNEKPGPAGFLVVDKPRGWTSHDVVDAARAWLGTRRVGHLGTLDPLATGVLPLAIREATKLVPFLEGGRKSYRGIIRLGQATDTLDADGKVVATHAGDLPSEAEIRDSLAAFVGDVQQVPPMYSAVKRDGVPLHRLAREGREVEREPKTVEIDRIEVLRYDAPEVEIEVDCSAGTYVRVLASDLGVRLGCGGYLADLERTRSGPFLSEHATSAEVLAAEAEAGAIAHRLIHPVNALGFPVLRLESHEVERVTNGNELAGGRSPVAPGTRLAAIRPDGELLAIMEMQPGRKIRPLRVLRRVADRSSGPGSLAPTP